MWYWSYKSDMNDTYKSHSQNVEDLVCQYPLHSFIICGDYDLPEILWDNDDNGLIYLYSSNTLATCIPETFASNGIFQNNSTFNNHKSISDHIFCNISFLVEKSLEPIVPIDSYHPPFELYTSLLQSYCRQLSHFLQFS